ncbi:MAG: hypothetical protein AMXMBFR58_04700 [Phycisphaerae bacterium]
MRQVRSARAVLFAAVISAAGGSAAANLVVNGSFEDPWLGGFNTTYGAGWPFLTGWTIGGEGIDHDAAFQAADGHQSVSTRWHDPSWIEQTIGTAAAQSYVVSFAATRERPEGSTAAEASTRGVEVWWNSLLVGSVTLPPDLTQTNADMHWKYYSFVVTGSGLDTLKLKDIDSGVPGYGAQLDDVRCVAVPTPAGTIPMMLAFIAGSRRRR